MTPDPYPGQDLLADVFDDTADAPKPLWNWYLTKMWPSPDDPRWAIRADLYPCHGGLRVGNVYSCLPREETA